jgi:hypothetical protein
VRAREQRRRQVRAGLSARAQIVETLLAEASPGEQAAPAPPTPTTPRLKQYHND